jgi:hypothetical protein
MVAGYVYSVAVVIARWSQPIRSKTSFFCFFFLLALAVDGLHRCKDRMYLVSSKYTSCAFSAFSALFSVTYLSSTALVFHAFCDDDFGCAGAAPVTNNVLSLLTARPLEVTGGRLTLDGNAGKFCAAVCVGLPHVDVNGPEDCSVQCA